MTFKDDLSLRVSQITEESWGDIPIARVPPGPEHLTFGNDGKHLDVCVLYADLHRSTEMVDSLADILAAEYYKAFLHCAGKIITRNGGTIQAYDGDRIMGIFVGDDRADKAVLAAFELHYAVTSVINPAFAATYPQYHRPLTHTVGIDAGRVLVAKIGVRSDSDLVWVGPAANYAAKLNSFDGLDINYPTRITEAVFGMLDLGLRVKDRQAIWDGPYTNVKAKPHYRSTWFSALT